jgi:hypothetical protein
MFQIVVQLNIPFKSYFLVCFWDAKLAVVKKTKWNPLGEIPESIMFFYGVSMGANESIFVWISKIHFCSYTYDNQYNWSGYFKDLLIS